MFALFTISFETVVPLSLIQIYLENLTRELRKAGISLCLDFVMNHTASTHRWAMAAKAGDPWFQAYYHLYEDRTIPDQYEQTVPQVFPNTAPGNFTSVSYTHLDVYKRQPLGSISMGPSIKTCLPSSGKKSGHSHILPY